MCYLVTFGVEIGMQGYTASGESGWQFCNLVELNGSKSNTPEEFYEQCKAGAILGTIQAGYTDFDFMPPATKEIVEREALIGVGITGWMNNPDVLFDAKVQRKGAEIVKHWNKVTADLIGINQAARTTCVKPAGNSSVLLETASGIHGEHSPRYIRYVQMNKETEVGQLFAKTNPAMVETSVWSDLDYVIGFPIETKKGSIYKSDLLGVKQLEYVKQAQNNWIEYGTNKHLCVAPYLRHNVSNTITVDDWDEVTKFIYENRDSLCGVSLLAASGDKAYPQAPFTEVLTHKQIVNKYGELALFTSALIEAGLSAFNHNLWLAIDTCLGYGEQLTDEHKDLYKRDFVRRFNKFAQHFEDTAKITSIRQDIADIAAEVATSYEELEQLDSESEDFDSVLYEHIHAQLRALTDKKEALEQELQAELTNARNICGNCLKDVYNLHKWWKITNTATDIDWTTQLSAKRYVDVDTLGAQACSGGQCEIEF